MSSLHGLLHRVFGLDRLRPGQDEVIRNVLEGRDTLAIMPTGAGKSLCYQLPTLKMSGTTLVVSPLIALMKDQVDKLAEAGVPAAQLNSTLSAGEEAQALEQVRTAGSEFVFTTPERLADPAFLATLTGTTIDLIVIDEAHCVSQWGHDFRPAFLDIGAAIRALGHPPVLALTATATTPVVEDIVRQLGLPDMRVINTGIYRANLHYEVVQVVSEDERLAEAVRRVREADGAGIVYAATVKAAETLHAALVAAGESAALYHGRLAAKVRKAQQEAFMGGSVRVMVATNAFGMGIDKADIRFVQHAQMPGNLLAYYQESGRAGRDGAAARCTLLYFARDRQLQQFFLVGRYPDADDLARVYAALVACRAQAESPALKALAEAVPGLSRGKLQVGLKLLKDAGFVAEDKNRRLRPGRRPPQRGDFEAIAQAYRDKDERDREALERMVFYAQTACCRWRVILEFFGEAEGFERCGECDNCRQPPVAQPVTVRQEHAVAPPPPAWPPGQRVRVPRYGEGLVAAAADGQVTVVFPDGSERSFVAEFVERLEGNRAGR